jgi:tripartite-type tricarboxylate transporter receptor subunit TctC
MALSSRCAHALARVVLTAFSCLALPTSVWAWPQSSVRFIVPLPPGVPADLVCRLFAERLSKRWQQPVVVENRQGADGLPAVSGFISARDEHTLMCSFPGIVTINPIVYENLPYDPVRDLVPVVSLSDNFIGVAVPATLNVNSLKDFVALARSQPGKLNWAASPGNPVYGFVALTKSAGLDMVQISYRDFRPALQDAAEGRIQAIATGIGAMLPLASTGKLKFLLVNNGERSPQAPEVPTAAEAGYPELTLSGLTGLYGWRDMPADLRERIASNVRQEAADPAIAERVRGVGSLLHVGSPADFAGALQQQRARIADIARSMR